MSSLNYLLCFVMNISLVLLFKINDSDYYKDYVPRVVNGHEAKLGDVPYQIAFKAQLKRSRIYVTFCGGTIVTETKLLSAAHCFADGPNFCQKLCCSGGVPRSLSHKYAVAGNLQNRGYYSSVDSEKDGQWRKLKKVVFPPSYKFPKDDIAIVFVKTPFVYTSFISNIPIASRLTDYIGSCLVSGFGRTSSKNVGFHFGHQHRGGRDKMEDAKFITFLAKDSSERRKEFIDSFGDTTEVLLLASLDLISLKKCNQMHHRNMKRFVCSSSKVTDVGKGDSGGPLVCLNTEDPNEKTGKGVLVGIVSGHRYGVSSFFTRVSSYYKYIERNKSQKIYLNFIVVIIIQTTFLLF